MTMELLRNDDYITTAGTNQGWRDFVEYVLEKDVRIYPNAAHLAEFGWSPFTVETKNELAMMLEKEPPDHVPTQELLSHLVEQLGAVSFADDDTVTVTDGLKD